MSALLYQKGKQMRKAIVYASVHHGNTEKLVKRIADECQFSLIDAVKQPNAESSASSEADLEYPLDREI